jgi:hypothetical protein
MTDLQLREELYSAFKHRAMLYYHIFQELQKEVGPEKAARILQQGIYRRGQELGKNYATFAPSNMEGLNEAFMNSVADNGKMFKPEVLRCDASGIDIKMHRCPLKEAWQEANLLPQEISRMCSIAAAIDSGTFEGAGFAFSIETWQPGQDGCCTLKIRPGK